MKERPIIFSGPMVRAILEGRKTQTRRVILPEPYLMSGIWRYSPRKDVDLNLTDHADLAQHFAPYGQVGDRLWVRETWWCPPNNLARERVSYREVIATACGEEAAKKNTWKPSIFMPRWASRILLEITGVRAQWLQDITPSDAIAEGHPTGPIPSGFTDLAASKIACAYKVAWFRNLWDSLNAKRGYGWDTNPWCWCLSFKRVD